MLYMATGKPAHLGCKFLSDVSVVNSLIVVELLVITALFCVVLPAEWQQDAIVASCWTYFTTIKHDARNHKYYKKRSGSCLADDIITIMTAKKKFL